jgi:UDP-glucose 4-epimerase
MRGIVTGGAGYVGSALVSRLLKEGHSVLSVDNLGRGDYKALEQFRENPRLKLVVADIRDRRQLEEVIGNFRGEVIFHLAALPGLQLCNENPEEAIEVNVLGTFNVLEVARRLGIKRVIFSSSAAVYGVPLKLPVDEEYPLRPLNLYGVTKVTGENLMFLYHENYGLETVILRFGNVHGVGLYTRDDTVIPKFVKLGLEGKPLTVYGDGNSSRDFVHVLDIVEAMRLAAEAEAVAGEAFNIGGENRKIGELAEIVVEEVAKTTGKEVGVVNLPPRVGETKEFSYSLDKTEKRLGFRPRWTVRESVRQLLNYYQKTM